MKTKDVPYIKDIVTEVADIQAPQNIDPYNLDLNGPEISPLLTPSDNNAIENLKDIINNTRMTGTGDIHQQDKNTCRSAGLDLKVTLNPDKSDFVSVTANIQTTEDKSMPDNYGTHTITVERYIESYT
ncbi:hypothetical protein Q4493_15440 [Colwellia sp. 1_MG-2023]|uniref:hypothetical protein n=1 Tax=Colwellia sp. 1_MG-2023 TaxID=3062649 RepID=UPI0026E4354F|nr:hypothetical protein [Colwellia sp. 1_MG-2023]MDO6447164.1 hypothetical protein [Colwellia sp. 1_MG-2023]